MFERGSDGADILVFDPVTLTCLFGGDSDYQGNNLQEVGVMFMIEQATADADAAGRGQYWVRTATPNEPMFTDDSDTDQLLDPSLAEINTQNGNYTFILTDKGKTIRKASGGAGETYTIPANSSVGYKIGTLIGIQNDGGGDLTIAITTDTLTGTDGGTASKTLGDNHTAVIQKVTSTAWKYAASDL